MKAIIQIIYFYVALLPSIVIHIEGHNSRYVSELDRAKIRIDEIVTNGENIVNIFKPLNYLGKDLSGSCIVYEGKLIPSSNKTVAMKFAPSQENEIRQEFEIYSYLNAINNPTVESYGIPAVYYYGEWQECQMIAITLLDSKFRELLLDNGESNGNVLDIFIIIREYVRISKYVHSRGVFHVAINLGNMMFRGNRGFMTDFNRASKLGDWPNVDGRKAEWGNFLYYVCNLCRIDVTRINEELADGGLKTVLLAFANYAKNAGQVEYNRMYGLITEEIREQEVQEPALVSWLTDEQKRQTSAGGTSDGAPDIQSIDDPYPATPFHYEPPNYDYFVNRR